MKKITTYFAIATLLFVSNSYSQKLSKPTLAFDYACLSASFNKFEANFSFTEKPFQANNVFYVELSDKNGSFDSPSVLKTINDQNYSFEFLTSFSLPTNVYGENYKIRLRATAPAMVSEATATFDAYFVPDENLVLNDYKDVSLCETSGALLQLNNDVAEEYIWYKDGNILKLTSDNFLNVTEPGEYYVEPYYGNCSGSIYSNLVIVTKGEDFNVSILGNKSIEPCSDSNIVLEASIDNENYVYTWFKDEEKLTDFPVYAPKIELENSAENFGTYRVEVTNDGGCTTSSTAVSILQNKSTVVEVTSPLNAVIIGDHTATLSIKTNNKGAEILWYKNGQPLKSGFNTETITVDEQGEYYAEVSSSNACEGSIKSPSFKIFEPVSFSAKIEPQTPYHACQVQQTTLKLTSLKGTLSNGDIITIQDDFFHNFNMKWIKDGTPLKTSTIAIPLTYTDNGNYQFEVTYKDKTYKSNTQEVVLGLPDVALTIEKNISCTDPNGLLQVTEIEGAEYKWFLNNDLVATTTNNLLSVTAEGNYTVDVSFKGCVVSSSTVTLEQNTDDLIAIYPGEQITIVQDRTVEATATGADSYEWVDSEGNILSTSATFSISKEGVYTLFAKIGACTIEKTVRVNSNDVVEIPNVISPNDDSVNDKWVLPQKFINDPEVEVVICDAYGSTVLKTNKYENNWPNSAVQTTIEMPVFYYFVNKKGKNIKKGSITLVN
ncbi:T9SS type B sorting domain-containing protein [Joostella sp. CR20]|uniref:T9SS type B sorting domain-containing protein n=1 Tax=Joostella sp. CR20 TaxID=2804312 RepID=UPI00313E16CC